MSNCSQCGQPLRSRKLNSVARTWALLTAAAILYVPANLFPVMTVTYFGDGRADTIVSGALRLMRAGDVPVALLVLFASVLVPIAKIALLGYLLVTIQRGHCARPRRGMRIYRILELVGRWSMLDVFMISILVALVQVGSLATIVAGPGAAAFAAVVILTMLAAHAFDQRLLWDSHAGGKGG